MIWLNDGPPAARDRYRRNHARKMHATAWGSPAGRGKMDLLEAIRKRRSVREYTGEPVDDAVLRELIEAGDG